MSHPRTKNGWQADHSHKSGRFRDYVCQPCNLTIGYVERYRLDLACIDRYLEKHYGPAEDN